ncbi:restriction endonuclease subunit S [Halomonas sp. FME1]|uniref:Restriction endonuclease subunit S n=1 Tax=Halomonas casei TaxID=2742613 RepID=A0ABR9F7Q7_9GAMM|nr:restriction endonuclease subunit S [Halomonas casei]MBE0401797.1 restriction endonuclease subunit S [Halomonas casei]
MSCNWPSVRLGELTDITSSKRIKRADYVTSGVPFFRSKEVIERSKGNDISTELFISEEQFSVIRDKFGAPEAGDILLTSVGTLGVPYQVRSTDRFYFKDGNLTWLRKFKESVLPEYVLYWLRSPVAQRKLDEVSIGSTQRALTIVALKSVEIHLPPKAVQARIVDMAMSLDQKLETNRNINQTLEQMAQAIFKSWFVDFEPVKAKNAALEAGGSDEDALLAAMQAISGKGEAELTRFQAEQPEQYAELRATAELFPSAMQDSELGEIPEGWRSGSLSDICDFQNGYAFKSKDWSDSGFAVVKIGSVKPEFVDLQSCSYVQENTVTGLERFELHAGDLLVGMTGYPGETGLVPISDNRIFLNQRVGRLRPKQQYHNALAYCGVRAPAFKQYIEGQAHGSAQANVSGKAIQQYALAIPTDSIANRFAGQVEPLLKQKLLFNAESSTLSEIRDTLLPKLLSGELSLSDANDLITEAAEPANV